MNTARALLVSPIHSAAALHPESIAIKLPDEQISYKELSQRVMALSKQLTDLGVNEGEPLACISSNNLQMICLYWACIEIGAIFFPISPRFPQAQVQSLIDSHNIRYLWSDSAIAPWQSQALTLNFAGSVEATPKPLDINRPTNVILTSGSSGTPKAAVHCLSNHIANAEGSLSTIDLEEGDSWLLSLPLFHIGGLAILNRCALKSATVVMPAPKISLSAQIEQDKLTHISLVPAQLAPILAAPDANLHSIKALLLGGGAISVDLLADLKHRNIACFTSYGMTEMGSQITTGPALADGSSGKLLPKRELKIIDGVIWVRGETLFMGYLSHKGIHKELDNDGWFYTKDRGEWDANGNLKILGRVDNMFISGGENVQPEEIEATLKLHPQIDEVIVFAEPDSRFGYLPAAIVRGEICQQLLEKTAELDDFLADKIARFKRPRNYYAWPESATQTGLKINRSAIIEAMKAAKA
ncbi:o-succinylbenzoate--CoA ligase [Shewanella sp. A25]|nr:o-succinylbenzoate--CoA ligase [Shewanella shenzhenensis]